MKSDKKLQAIFNKAPHRGEYDYYFFKDFKEDIRDYFKDLKNHKKNTICSMKVSRSGMTRHFNFDKYNMLFNIVYSQKRSWAPVRVGGLGMDMHWSLKFSVCKQVFTKGENDKHRLNSKCSSGKIL